MNDIEKMPKVNKWLIAFAVMTPTFMEIMDTTVVNVSLPHIRGSMSAGVDEVTWVLTSYLVTNAIVIPMSGWLSRVFGRKRYLLLSILIFTASSVVCGAAPSLAVLIIARIFQGMGGGGLQPISQAILLESFSKKERGLAMSIFGMGVVIAPIIGPFLGGWVTDSYSWRWIFYINLPAGLLATGLITFCIYDPPYMKRLRLPMDRWGLFFLCIGIGSLQIVLDKGQRDDWFNSDFIICLTMVSVISLICFVRVELRSSHPVVDLRVFRSISFSTGSILVFAGFFSLFGGLVMLPLFVQELMGYTAFWAGYVLGPGGIAAFIAMPLAGSLMKKDVSPRLLLCIGLCILIESLRLMSGFTLDAAFLDIAWPRIVMGFGLGLFFVPITSATFMDIPNEKTSNASAVFNLLRNLGASLGVAFSVTVLARRSQVHQNFLVENITPFRSVFQEYEKVLSRFLSMRDSLAGSEPLAFIYQQVSAQARLLAYNDSFWILSLLLVFLLPITYFLRSTDAGGDRTNAQ